MFSQIFNYLKHLKRCNFFMEKKKYIKLIVALAGVLTVVLAAFFFLDQVVSLGIMKEKTILEIIIAYQ